MIKEKEGVRNREKLDWKERERGSERDRSYS